MQFQVEGISENWLKFKKDGIGVEYKGNEICMQTYYILKFKIKRKTPKILDYWRNLKY